MKEYIIHVINTTVGKRYLVVTYSKSKEFKTEKGARNYIKKLKGDE